MHVQSQVRKIVCSGAHKIVELLVKGQIGVDARARLTLREQNSKFACKINISSNKCQIKLRSLCYSDRTNVYFIEWQTSVNGSLFAADSGGCEWIIVILSENNPNTDPEVVGEDNILVGCEPVRAAMQRRAVHVTHINTLQRPNIIIHDFNANIMNNPTSTPSTLRLRWSSRTVRPSRRLFQSYPSRRKLCWIMRYSVN